MNNRMKRKVAVINKSVILKRLRSIEELSKKCNTVIIPQTELDKINDVIVVSILRVIENLSKEYTIVIIPQTVFEEIFYATTESTRQLLKTTLSNDKVVIKDYVGDYDIFDFAKNASKEFKCPVDIITCDFNPSPQVECTQVKYTFIFKKENNE